MKTIVLCIAIVSCLASHALARDQGRVFLVFGGGYSSCGRMTEDVKKGREGVALYREWINGYVSATNYFLLGKANYFEGYDQIAAYKFVLKYCEDNPLDSVLSGVHKLLLHYNVPLP